MNSNLAVNRVPSISGFLRISQNVTPQPVPFNYQAASKAVAGCGDMASWRTTYTNTHTHTHTTQNQMQVCAKAVVCVCVCVCVCVFVKHIAVCALQDTHTLELIPQHSAALPILRGARVYAGLRLVRGVAVFWACPAPGIRA